MKTTLPKTTASIEASALARHSRDTGIPQPELRRLCLRAGLDMLDKGKLVISAQGKASKRVSTRTIEIPADAYARLKELGKEAGTGTNYLAEMLIDHGGKLMESGQLTIKPCADIEEASKAYRERFGAKKPQLQPA